MYISKLKQDYAHKAWIHDTHRGSTGDIIARISFWCIVTTMLAWTGAAMLLALLDMMHDTPQQW